MLYVVKLLLTYTHYIVLLAGILINLCASAGVIKLTTGDNYFPFADSKLPSAGWSQMLIERAYQLQQQAIVIERFPWQRTLKRTEMLQADLAFPYIYTKPRAEKFYYSNPINHIQVQLFVAKKSTIRHLADINQHKFCMPHGYALNRKLKNLIAEHHGMLIRAKAEQGCLNQIRNGWSDIGFINRFYNKATIEQRYGHANEFRVLPEIIDVIDLYAIVSKKHPQAKILIKHFNEGLLKLEQTGERQLIDNFYQQWLTKNHP